MQIGDLNIWNELQFKRSSRDLDLFSRGDYSPLSRYLREAYPNTDLPIRAVPFVQRYVAELAGIYSHAPIRRFGGVAGLPDPVWQKLQAVYTASGVDKAGEEAERHLWVQNCYLAVLMPDGIGRVREQPILPHQVVEIQIDDPMRADDPTSWTKLTAMVPMSSAGGQVIQGEMVLTRSTATRQLGGKVVGLYADDGSHPFGTLPVIVAYRVTPDAGRPLPPVNEAVLNVQVLLSTRAADDELIIRHCAFPQKVVTNGTAGMQAETLDGLGPDSVYMLPNNDSAGNGPDMKVVQGQVPVSELVAYQEHQVRLYTSLLGLDPSAFLRQGGVAVTAEARLFTAQDRKALRDRIIPTLLRLEQARLRMLVQVLALREPMSIPVDTIVDVTYFDDTPTAGRQSEAQALAIEIPLGVSSPVDVVMARDGVSRSVALAQVKRTLAELKDLGLGVATKATKADAPDKTTDAATVADGAAVADTAMNGAQVTGLLSIIAQVAAKQLPPEAAVQVIGAAFPSLDAAKVRAMVSAAAAFTPAPAEVTP